MASDISKLFRSSHQSLCDHMEPGLILETLVSKEVITEQAAIKNRRLHDRFERNADLLGWLRDQPDSTMEIFRRILIEHKQGHLLQEAKAANETENVSNEGRTANGTKVSNEVRTASDSKVSNVMCSITKCKIRKSYFHLLSRMNPVLIRGYFISEGVIAEVEINNFENKSRQEQNMGILEWLLKKSDENLQVFSEALCNTHQEELKKYIENMPDEDLVDDRYHSDNSGSAAKETVSLPGTSSPVSAAFETQGASSRLEIEKEVYFDPKSNEQISKGRSGGLMKGIKKKWKSFKTVIKKTSANNNGNPNKDTEDRGLIKNSDIYDHNIHRHESINKNEYKSEFHQDLTIISTNDGLIKNDISHIQSISKKTTSYPSGDCQLGYALIINNWDFQTKNLNRNKVDGDNLQNLFKELGYKMYKNESHYQNLKTEVMRNVIVEFVNDGCHKEKECRSVILFISSHGDENGVYSTNNVLLTYDTIKKLFGESKTLNGIPKFLFFQACRGEILDSGIGVDSKPDALPTFCDMLICHASYNGMFAYRNNNLGSYFIMFICTVFFQYAHEQHIAELMTMVNDYICFESYNYEGKDAKMTSTTESSLRAAFYFYQ